MVSFRLLPEDFLVIRSESLQKKPERVLEHVLGMRIYGSVYN